MGMAPESVSREEWNKFQYKLERFMEEMHGWMRPVLTYTYREPVTLDDIAEKLEGLSEKVTVYHVDQDHDLEFIKQRIAWYRPFEGYTHPQSKQEPHLPQKQPRTFADTENPDLAAANRRISAGADLKTAAKRLLESMDISLDGKPAVSRRNELAKAVEAWCNLEPTEGS